MPVPCFTRHERNGMHVLFPLEGRMKHDCMIVNDTVHRVYELLRDGIGLDELTARFATLNTGNGAGSVAGAANGGPPVAATKRNFDLYRILFGLRDRQLCDYSFDELLTLLPKGNVIPGTTQVLPTRLLHQAAAFLARSLDPAGDVRPFFSFYPSDRIPVEYFGVETLARKHLDQAEVYFVALDAEGEVEAATAVLGLQYQPQTLTALYVAARYDGDQGFEERAGIHLARLCGLLSVVSLSAKLRMQVVSGGQIDSTVHPGFERVVGELEFRRIFHLADEMGPGTTLTGYDRALF